MNDVTPIVCRQCRQELPLAVEDRVAAPILVDMTVRLHLDVCERVAVMADVLVTEVEQYAKAEAR